MEKSCFGWQQGKVCAKEKLLVCENGNFFADSEERHVQKKFLCVKKDLSEVRKVSANEFF